MHGHGWRVAAGMDPHCTASRLPPPGICHKGLRCVSQTGTARCRQAAGYGPEVKWLKSRGGNVLCRRWPRVLR
jgi:hypothetical protein